MLNEKKVVIDKKDSNKNELKVNKPLKKKPVVEVLSDEKNVVFASEMAAHCNEIC